MQQHVEIRNAKSILRLQLHYKHENIPLEQKRKDIIVTGRTGNCLLCDKANLHKGKMESLACIYSSNTIKIKP